MSTAWRKIEGPELSECPSCGQQEYVPDRHCPDQCARNSIPDDVAFDMAIESLIEHNHERRREL